MIADIIPSKPSGSLIAETNLNDTVKNFISRYPEFATRADIITYIEERKCSLYYDRGTEIWWSVFSDMILIHRDFTLTTFIGVITKYQDSDYPIRHYDPPKCVFKYWVNVGDNSVIRYSLFDDGVMHEQKINHEIYSNIIYIPNGNEYITVDRGYVIVSNM